MVLPLRHFKPQDISLRMVPRFASLIDPTMSRLGTALPTQYGMLVMSHLAKKWGLATWGVLHSSLMLYEANDVQEAMMVQNRRLILVSPFQQPSKTGAIFPYMENNDYNNVMGIMEMLM